MAYFKVEIPKGETCFLPMVTALGRGMSGTSDPDVWLLRVQFEDGAIASLPMTQTVIVELSAQLVAWEKLRAIRESRRER